VPGRAIRIFLVDGTPTGLRTAELGLSTIKAVLSPRGSLQQFAQRDESRRTGVYVLVGSDPEVPGRLKLYVGEGDDVLMRILTHDKDSAKDFWDRAIVFVSKDSNLTKAHGRFLEARLVELAQKARRCTVDNKTAPNGGTLPEADTAEMEEFIEQAKTILAVFGVNAFEPEPLARSEQDDGRSTQSLALHTEGEGFEANCVLRDGQFIVSAGSRARLAEAPSLPGGSKDQRKQLVGSGVLVQDGAALRFTQDYAFPSSSAAAQVIAGSSVSGPQYWHLADGRTLKEWQDAQIQPLEGAEAG
jgi:hypothetical protein